MEIIAMQNLNDKLWLFIVIGFFSQLVDSATGMAYGICSTSMLTFAKLPIGIVSVSVHTSEILTTLISGLSHLKLKNVDWIALKQLIPFGMIGGMLGVIVVSNIEQAFSLIPVYLYLMIMGVYIACNRNTESNKKEPTKNNRIKTVALLGGFLDAIGGGWGPIATSNMLALGYSPRFTIGTINLAEFFITLVQVITFSVFFERYHYLKIAVFLAIGGGIAAPISALICKKVNGDFLKKIIGVMLIILNMLNITKEIIL